MTVFAVERDLKGITMDQLAGAQKAAISKADEMTTNGTKIDYIRSTFIPGEDRCTCLFDAGKASDVKRLNDEANIPYNRIVQALDLTP